jgi:chromosome segregation ATPase
MDKAKAREDLSKSNEQIEENNSRISQQEEQFKQLVAYGHETEAVQGQLKDLKQEKESIERHRERDPANSFINRDYDRPIGSKAIRHSIGVSRRTEPSH